MRLPGIAGKAFAVIGVRRGGKTSFLAQCRADQLAKGSPPDAQLFISLKDERLAGLNKTKERLVTLDATPPSRPLPAGITWVPAEWLLEAM